MDTAASERTTSADAKVLAVSIEPETAMRWEATPRSIARSATPRSTFVVPRIARSIGNSCWLDALLAQTICACPGPLVTHLRLRVGAVLAWVGSPGQAQATEVTCAGEGRRWGVYGAPLDLEESIVFGVTLSGRAIREGWGAMVRPPRHGIARPEGTTPGRSPAWMRTGRLAQKEVGFEEWSEVVRIWRDP